jgi:hypothetical protein
MRRNRARALTFLCLGGAAACGPTPSLETRTFDLQYLEPTTAYEIIEPYVYADRPDAPGRIGLSEAGRTLTVRERPDNLDRIARVLAERDRPRPEVTLHFQIIEAGPGPAEPDPAIAGVEAALREVFRFGGYRLTGEAVVRAAEHSPIRQRVAGPAAHSINGHLSAVRTEQGGPATARLAVTFWTDERTPALETTVNLVDGRTIVLGTAGGRGDDGAVILAVRPVFER